METLILYMVIPGRINFLQLGRNGKSCEQRFRRNFPKDFDRLEFNLSLSERILTGDRKATAIDPGYISKSGKNTPWIGYFRSGTAGQAKRGPEIPGVGLVDIDNKDCISLQDVRTPDSQTLESKDANLMDRYLLVVNSMREKLRRTSRYIVADAYFAKSNFDINNGELYTLVAWSKSLKQTVRLVIRYFKDGKKPKLFFSANRDMTGKDVMEYYRTRFQIVFCFPEAKGLTGLMQSRARDAAKLSFNFNTSLTTVNRAKVLAKKRGILFSMVSCKMMINNTCLLDRFIRVSGIKPNRRLNDKPVKELIEFAAIAA